MLHEYFTACLHIRIRRVHIYIQIRRVSVFDDDDQHDRSGVRRCSDSIEISVLIELVNMRKALRWHLNIHIYSTKYDGTMRAT